MDPLISLQSGRYVLEDLLGSGHFGEVWRARDELLGDSVAIKLMEEHVTLDGVVLEAQVLTRLERHDRVVTIKNIDVSPPRPFIVMEYLERGSVEQQMEAGEVSLVNAIRWTRDALDGLAFVHSMGIIHRDIKPANLLLDQNGNVVLSDFGLAEDTIRDLLATEEIYWPHAAPELFAGSPSSVETDIFATGCTLYRLITGEYPFEDDEQAASWEFVDVHHRNPQVPLRLTRVVRKALALQPKDRYGNARAMLSDLLSCGVRACWIPLEASDDEEHWEATTSGGVFLLRLRRRNGRGFELTVHRDKGAGPRRILRLDFDRKSQALRARRAVLLTLVEGRQLG